MKLCRSLDRDEGLALGVARGFLESCSNMFYWMDPGILWVGLVVTLNLWSPVAAQTTRPDTEATANQPAEAMSRPASQPARKPFNLWTASNMTGDWGGVRSDLEKLGFTLEVFHNEQYQQNFHGGLHTDNALDYSGSTDIHTILDLGKTGLVPGALLFLEAKSHWGEGINKYVGALFDPNADIVGNYPIYLNKWWYRQYLFEKKLEFRIGVLETKKDDMFDISQYAYNEDKDFWNYEILRDTTIPHRIGAGAFLRVKPVDWYYFQAAAIDAKNPPRQAQIETAFGDDPRYVGYWETGLTPKWPSAKGPMPGKYRIGWWYDGRDKAVFRRKSAYNVNVGSQVQSGDMGWYLGFDQMIWKELADPKDSQGLGFFSRFGADNGSVNKVADYWELGLSYTGLVPTRGKDVTAFGFAQSALSKQYRDLKDDKADAESVYEWYYSIQVTPWFFITPDLQVIVNPGGDTDARDALVGGVRIRVVL